MPLPLLALVCLAAQAPSESVRVLGRSAVRWERGDPTALGVPRVTVPLRMEPSDGTSDLTGSFTVGESGFRFRIQTGKEGRIWLTHAGSSVGESALTPTGKVVAKARLGADQKSDVELSFTLESTKGGDVLSLATDQVGHGSLVVAGKTRRILLQGVVGGSDLEALGYGKVPRFLAIDLDGDGTFATGTDGRSPEVFALAKPFRIGALTVQASFDETRQELLLIQSEAKAPAAPPTMLGRPAPDFKMVTVDGKALTLSSLRGRWVVLDLWATWCQPCLKALPAIDAFRKRTNPRQVRFVALSVMDSKDRFLSFAKGAGKGYGFLLAHDPAGNDAHASKIVRPYQANVIPRSIVIDPKGMVRFYGQFHDEASLEEQFRRLGIPFQSGSRKP